MAAMLAQPNLGSWFLLSVWSNPASYGKRPMDITANAQINFFKKSCMTRTSNPHQPLRQTMAVGQQLKWEEVQGLWHSRSTCTSELKAWANCWLLWANTLEPLPLTLLRLNSWHKRSAWPSPVHWKHWGVNQPEVCAPMKATFSKHTHTKPLVRGSLSSMIENLTTLQYSKLSLTLHDLKR